MNTFIYINIIIYNRKVVNPFLNTFINNFEKDYFSLVEPKEGMETTNWQLPYLLYFLKFSLIFFLFFTIFAFSLLSVHFNLSQDFSGHLALNPLFYSA